MTDSAIAIFYHRQLLNKSLGNHIIKGYFGYHFYSLVKAITFDLATVFLINIIFIYANQGRNAEVAANANYTFKVMNP